MANKTLNTFRGVNTDTSINKYPNDKYYSAKNLRFITNDSLSSEAVNNLLEPSKIVDTSVLQGTILGSTTVRDTIVIFFKTDSGISIIFKTVPDSGSLSTVYSDAASITKLGFDISYPIRAVGRYENNLIQKVYWCDGLNPNAFINIAESNSGKEASVFKLTPNVELNSPIPQEVNSGGILESGVIYYAYQLYRENGNQTSISSSSFGVPLSSRNGKNIKNFRGDEVGVNTGQSVILDIDNLDSNFDHIKVYSIHFADLNADPTISLILDQETTSTSITIVDTGAITLETLTTEEFLGMGGRIFSSVTLETKYNYLFAGGIKESSKDIDFDANSYRFNDSNIGYSVDISGTPTNVSSSNWDTVDDDSDSINPFNDLDNDLEYNSSTLVTSSQNYKYVNGGGGSVIGGQGPNIGYTFTTQRIQANSATPTYKSTTEIRNIVDRDESFLNPILAGKYKGYKRGEIYRFGIEFHFKNGQKSFVKWIGDIRFPTIHEVGLSYTASSILYNNQLGLRLTADLSSLSTEDYNNLSGIKIVRAKRNSYDKNILGQGLFGPYQYASYKDLASGAADAYSSYGRVPNIYDTAQGIIAAAQSEIAGGTYTPAQIELSTNLHEFNSPEFVFGDTPNYSGQDFINLVGAYDVIDDNGLTESSSGLPRGYFRERNYAQDGSLEFNYNRVLSDSTSPSIKTIGGNEDSLFSFSSAVCSNRTIIENSDRDYNGIRAEHTLLDMDTSVGGKTIKDAAIAIGTIISDPAAFIAEYTRNVFGSQYGGNTHNARQTTNYVPALCRLGTTISDDVVEFIPISEASAFKIIQVDVFGGDTYVSNFDYLRTYFDSEVSTDVSLQEYITFPIETSYNLDYRRDEILRFYTALTEHNADSTSYKIQEEKSHGILLFPSSYPTDITDLYLYNDAYSRNNNIVTNIQQPENFQEALDLDTMVVASDKKFNGESIDSWTTYRFNNFLEVDSTYGPLNVLKNYNNKLFYFQDHGFGILAVEDRAQISTGSGELLTLGSGDSLERYDYLSTNFGALRDEAVLSTPNNLYFIDELDKSIRIPTDNDLNGNLSKIKRVSSKIHSLLPSTYLSLGFDPLNKEVYFSFDDTTFVYSELLQEFTGDYDIVGDKTFDGLTNKFKSDTYQVIKDNLYLISYNNELNRLHVHKANFGTSALGDFSEITLLIHPNGNDIYTFDNLDLRTTVFDSFSKNLPLDTDVVDDTIHEIDYKNSYLPLTQITTNPGLGTALINRLARSWRTQVPLTTSDNRFVDSYLMVTLRYNNSDSNKILIHDVSCYVRKANINI